MDLQPERVVVGDAEQAGVGIQGQQAPNGHFASSSLPGFSEHAHPVAAEDFCDVDGRVATTHQFRAEDGKVSWSAEIPDVVKSIGLIVGHLGRI
jgi:hypothetical protein